MPIEAIIFDMDGVLVDSEVYWLTAREAFARDLGRVWTDEHQRRAMGRSTVEWAQVMQDILQPPLTVPQIMADVIARVMRQYEAHMPARPGALAAVHLAAQHYRVALASGSPTAVIDHVLRLTGLDAVFGTVVYGDDMRHGKPAPDIYLETMRRLNVTPAVSLGIEDSGNGLRSLKAAGMYAIAAPSPAFPLGEDLLRLADAHIASLEEFNVALVERIGGA
ncbi:MAG: HAD family phosphatase [Anaerolineae bacterium]|nr:HAD family phosphatase [Anaerolineae bacterium]